VACDYVLDVCPSLGVNRKTGEGMVALGNNRCVLRRRVPSRCIVKNSRIPCVLIFLLLFRFVCLGSGDIVLMHHEKIKSASSSSKKSKRNGDGGGGGVTSSNGANGGVYEPSAFLYTPKDGGLGHRDVVRCMYHDIQVKPRGPAAPRISP
jgi:hypothetical protein